jgi:hypothetical protein
VLNYSSALASRATFTLCLQPIARNIFSYLFTLIYVLFFKPGGTSEDGTTALTKCLRPNQQAFLKEKSFG